MDRWPVSWAKVVNPATMRPLPDESSRALGTLGIGTHVPLLPQGETPDGWRPVGFDGQVRFVPAGTVKEE